MGDKSELIELYINKEEYTVTILEPSEFWSNKLKDQYGNKIKFRL